MSEDATLDAFASSDGSDGDEEPASESRNESAASGDEPGGDEPGGDEPGVAPESSDSEPAATPEPGGSNAGSDAVAGSDEPSGDAELTAESEGEPSDSAADSSDARIDPARSTYDWTPDGGECADCGASAERRWRRDGQKDGELVCADCKEW